METSKTSLNANSHSVNEDISRDRKSKRKPMRPTKGIYSVKSPNKKEPSANVKTEDTTWDTTKELIKPQIVTSSLLSIPTNNNWSNEEGNKLTSSDSCVATSDIEIELPFSSFIVATSIKESVDVDTVVLKSENELIQGHAEDIKIGEISNSIQSNHCLKQESPERFFNILDTNKSNSEKPARHPSSNSSCHQINRNENNKLSVKDVIVASSSDSPPKFLLESRGQTWNSVFDDTSTEVKHIRRSRKRIHKNIEDFTDAELSQENSGRKRAENKHHEENSKKVKTFKKLKHSSRRDKSLKNDNNNIGIESTRDSENVKLSTELKLSILNNSNAQKSLNEIPAGVRNKQKFKCPKKDCDLQFSKKDRLDNHFKRQHEGIRNLFACSICSKTFPARRRLATHLQRHEMAEKTYPCSQCDKSFPTQKKLDFHLYQHDHNWGLYCDICKKGFPAGQEQRLANHKKIHDESRPRPFECSICGRKFSSQQYLNIHQKNHPIQPDDDGLYRCNLETCRQLSFKAVTSFREHQKNHTGELPFECEVCGKKFGYITGYRKHMISHTDEKHHVCHVCGKQFKQKGNLNLHVERHSGIKPYKCTFPGCDYSFFDQYKLKNHAGVHTGKRIFKCVECEKCFRTTTGLKNHHAVVHAKERKYNCHCGKTFSQKQYLQFHKTQHPELNMKRFTCEVCSKKFSEPSSLREHKRRFHTGETSFHCDKCDYTACFKSRMDKHLLTHSKPQFDCTKCGKQFKHGSNLKRHLATIHSTKRE